MRVFVAGGTGFIGIPTVKRLLEQTDHELMLLVIESEQIPAFLDAYPRRVTVLRGELENLGRWATQLVGWRPEATINLAWEGIPRYGHDLSMKNFSMTLPFIQLVATTGCRKYVGAGSCWEYGTKVGKLAEESPALYRDTFTSVKNSLHFLGRAICENSGMIFVWPRFFYVYGPGQKEQSLIPTIIRSIGAGEMPKIRTLDAENDFIYVSDIASGLCALLDRCETSGIYNIGTGSPTRVRDIVRIVYEQLGMAAPDLGPGEQVEKICYYADNSKIRSLGWRSLHTMEQGIRKLLTDRGMFRGR